MTTYFDPLAIGDLALPNRIIMPPLTRARATENGSPVGIMADYYRQRASAGLIISEGTYVSRVATGFERAPGVYTQAQIDAWKPVTDAVHDEGGRIFCQLWHCGRVSASYINGGTEPLSPSGVNDDPGLIDPYAKLENGAYVKIAPTPSRAMTRDEIKATIADFAQAAANAREAGFDGVEIHAANGYLPNQFLADRLNRRGDEYGGSVENRARFIVDIFDAIAERFPAKRVGIRFSPFAVYNNALPSDAAEIYAHLARKMQERGAAYIHFADMNGWFGFPDLERIIDTLRPNFAGPIIANGGITVAQGADLLATGKVQAIAFGRGFLANPDLVARIAKNAPLNEAPAGGWYARGTADYTDFPTLDALETVWPNPVHKEETTMAHNAADRQTIIEAVSKYTWGYDIGDFAMLRDSFTENATSGGVVSGTDVKWGPMQGREEIATVLEGIRKTQTDQRRHNVSNFLFLSQTDSAAKFRCYLTLLATEGGVTKLVTGGYYEIDAVKEGDTWRMSRLDGVLDAPF